MAPPDDPRPRVSIVATGVANTASVAAGFRRCGAEPVFIDDPASAQSADYLVLPGVGSFAAGMACLRERDLVGVIRDRVDEGRPTLAVCLGLQLLCESSEESPGVEGLAVVPARIERFPADVRAPQFGWNSVEPGPASRYVRAGYAYYANSYRLPAAPEGWAQATTVHASPFAAAIERGRVLACQFHPELSGRWGLALVKRWLQNGEEAPSC
ncbi:MAG: imidazole glycerol phosphate synthase subunit HisH [Phycisphaeraceae bacterium]|nr:MAG: imidazole glycerol phosphate synthase subunit HisH [Phycisphaeraceae bacterium]